MSRKSNDQLADDFRHLLTHRAKEMMSEQTLADTKEWRNELWKAFNEIHNRLCPLREIKKSKN